MIKLELTEEEVGLLLDVLYDASYIPRAKDLYVKVDKLHTEVLEVLEVQQNIPLPEDSI